MKANSSLFSQRLPFVATATAIVGLLLRAEAQTPAPPVRMKLEEFIKDTNRVNSLKKGVAVMKSREPSNPKSWFYQAAVHGYSSNLYAEALQRDPKVANVDSNKFWNQCPHYSKTASADFLIWHRAYVYYFERILREASGDSNLTLPYWNYTESGQRTFPALFANPEPDSVTKKPTNPLYDGQRESTFASPRSLTELNPAAVNYVKAFGEDKFFGTVAADGFGGSAADVGADQSGLLEGNPHNLVHLAVGGRIGEVTNPDPANDDDWHSGLMAIVQTAAFDPVFWVHHCNIDRLWNVWDSMPGRNWGFSPGPSWFSEKVWWFNDADGQVYNLSRSNYISPKTLSIAFDSDISGVPRLTDRLPGAANLIAFNIEAASGAIGVRGDDRSVHILATDNRRVTITPSMSLKKALLIKVSQPFGAKSVQESLTTSPVAKPRKALLILDGIEMNGIPSVSYQIYINFKQSSPDPANKAFVGELSLFRHKHEGEGHRHSHAFRQVFDITKQIDASVKDGSQLEVQIIPVPLVRPTQRRASTEDQKRPAESITIGGMAISLVEGSVPEQ